MMKILVLLLLVSTTSVNSESASGILSGIAQNLNNQVHHNHQGAFNSVFQSPQQSTIVTNLANGQLFNNPTARNSFSASVMPGAKYTSNHGEKGVIGKLRMEIYNPARHQTTAYAFQVNAGHTERQANRWGISSIHRIPLIERVTLSPPRGSFNRKSSNRKSDDSWMYYIY